MDNDFTQIMHKQSDAELIKIVTLDSYRYQEAAIEAANREIQFRNIDAVKFASIKQQFISEPIQLHDLETATVGSGLRFANSIIDSIAIGFCWVALKFVMDFLFSITNEVLLIIFINGSVLASIQIYYIVLEARFTKTLGKHITNTKVITIDGKKPDFNAVFIRSLCRFIPFYALSFLFTKNGFHDKFSKTTVVLS